MSQQQERGGHGRGSDDRGGGFQRGGRGGGSGGSGSAPIEVYSVHGNGPAPPPNADVTKIENDYMKKSSGIEALSSLSITTAFPARPAHGTQGKSVVVWANFLDVKPRPNLLYFRYSVEVKAEGKAPQPSKIKTKRILALLLEVQDFRDVKTDFRSNLYSLTKLPNVPRDIIIPFRAQVEDAPLVAQANYRISIQDTGTILISQYLDYLKSSAPNAPHFAQRNEALQTLNTVFGHHPQMRLDIATMGQNKHYRIDPSISYDLGGGLQALRGFFKSFRPATSRLLLNVNVSHAVCYAPLRLDYLLNQIGLQNDKPRLARKLKLVRVQRLHLQDKKNKAGQIIPSVAVFWDFATTNDGQSDAHPPQVPVYGSGPKVVKFFLIGSQPAGKGLSGKATGKVAGNAAGASSGQYVSIWDYFSKNYPQIKMNPNYPVVNVGNRQSPRYLPVEACRVLPGQPVGAKLSPDETRKMIEFACRKPVENANSIMRDGREVLGLDPLRNAALGKNELTVNTALLTVHARVLQPPQIKYLGPKPLNPAFGSWNMEGCKFYKGSAIGRWTYLHIKSPNPKPNPNTIQRDSLESTFLEKTVLKFAEFMRKLGINIPSPLAIRPNFALQNGPEATENNNQAIENCLRKIWKSPDNPDRPQFILVILPYNDATVYGQIKTMADRKAGFHTVCVIGSKFMKEQRQEQYFANVALKFNLKAGGINQVLDPSKLGIISEGKTMVVGIDVTHPSPQSQSTAPSVAGIVASIDKYLGQWPSDLRVQTGRQEMVADLELLFKSRLVLWQKHNKVLPENVLVYRDGVSEGQYQTVLDEELPRLRAACAALYPAKKHPAISIIIVGKRHHVRFYPTRVEDADRSSNCKNGTVVDRGVTEVRFWHFYLQAHACLQGTARSAHYYVVMDEIFRARAMKSANPIQRNAADALEDLTHNMCHLFGRATKAVSICPPAYYADLLCERSRHYLSNYFDPTTPAPSVASKPNPDGPKQTDVEVNERLRDSMYYI